MSVPDAHLTRLLDRLDNVRPSGSGYSARCPAHHDRDNSLSVGTGEDGRILVKCHAGCDYEKILEEIKLTKRDLFTDGRGEGGKFTLLESPATVHQAGEGCTLAAYAEAKQLPLDFLSALGLSDIYIASRPAVRIPYRTPAGAEGPIRLRSALHKGQEGDNRFSWRKGSKPTLYGLDRLDRCREAGYAVLVEGESDCHTLWYHGIPALGLPGAANWREERDAAHLDGIATIFVLIEPDQGGEAVEKWLARSRIRERAALVSLGAEKDPSALHLAYPESANFAARWGAVIDAAIPWFKQERAEAQERARAAWEECRDLASSTDILAQFAAAQDARGIAGEERTQQIIYLAVTSRFLARPVSVAVKGPSSGGKSYTTERTLDYFPPEAYYALSAMSEHALAYSDEPLRHRFLVIYEAAGMVGDMASYLMRSLLSEGCIRYETVEKTRDGLQGRLIAREGPTGLLVTTTATHLHPENETRLLSIPVTDTAEQTRRVFRAIAARKDVSIDFTPWHALQQWLAGAEHRVTIPYANALAEELPSIAVRLRRDFTTLLNLIAAHAILHQVTRGRDADGAIVATLADYGAVRALVADLIAEGIEATVPATVRETVAAVERARGGTDNHVSITKVAQLLALDKSAASRRVRQALDRGYLRNEESGKGRPAKLAIGDPLPDEIAILPSVAALQGCAYAEGATAPPHPPAEQTTISTDDSAADNTWGWV